MVVRPVPSTHSERARSTTRAVAFPARVLRASGGAFLLGVATRALRSMGWSRTLLANLAALRPRAAARFSAMMARTSGETLAFFATLRLRAANLRLAIRAT